MNNFNKMTDNAEGYIPKVRKGGVKGKSGRATVQFITYKGRTLSMNQWSEELGIEANTIRQRYKRGLPTSKILSPIIMVKAKIKETFGNVPKGVLKHNFF